MNKRLISLSFVIFLCVFQLANAATFTVNNTNDAGAGSMRQAIIDANANAGADIIDATGISGTISLLSVLPNITESVTIMGPGMTLLTINQTIDRRVFTTGTGAINFVLQDLTLNFAGPGTVPYSGGGGAILAGGAGASTVLTNVTISNFNQQIGNGGAISQSSSLNSHSLTITNCIFINNKCGGAGGAISFNSQGGTATITGCTFSGNQTGPVGLNTGGDGGAIATTGGGSGGTYQIEKNTFLNNQVLNVTGHAGAVMNTNGTLTLRYNRFIGNTCANVANPPLANIVGQAGGATTHTTIADNNWWGVNTGPGANDATALAAGAIMTLSKWLQLKTTASTDPICAASPSILGHTSTVTTSFLSNSASEAIAIANLTTVIGLPVVWGPTTLGSLSGEQGTIHASGTATAMFTSNGTGGTATVNTQVDNVPDGETSPSRASITVNTLSTPPTGATGTTIDSVTSATLTVSGGVKGEGALTEWFSDSCGGTLEFTGDEFTTPILTTNTTYYVRYNGACNTTECATVMVNINLFEDADGDGFKSDVDCNDNDPSINPNAQEICDGIDNDCDGLIDDEDGNLIDVTAPIAPIPPTSLNLECADDIPAPVDLTATDNCEGNITVSPTVQITSGNCLNDFSMERTWTFTDTSGNTSSVSQTINVNDATPPVLIVPNDMTIKCDDPQITNHLTVNSPAGIAGEYLTGIASFGPLLTSIPITANLQLVNDGQGNPSDACESPLDDLLGKIALIDRDICLFVDKVKNAQNAGALAVIIINNVGTDEVLNFGGIDPMITIPSVMVSKNTGDALKTALLLGTVNATLSNPEIIVSDNCDGSPTVTVTQIVESIICRNSFTRIITWTATDACGNETSKTQRIKVEDTTAPVAPEPPAALTLQCVGEVPQPIDLTAIDNCSGSITVSPSDEVFPGSSANDFTIVRTWSFNDVCGNISSISQTITVYDDTLPAISCPADIVVDNDSGTCGALVSWIPPVGTDNCQADTTSSHNPGDYFPIGTTTVTYTAEDSVGNTASCSFDVIVNTIHEITVQPVPETEIVYGCEAPILTVEATVGAGNTIAYQWYSNTTNSNSGGTPILGATSSTYQTPRNYSVGTYNYYVELTANSCPIISDVATVIITPQVAAAVGEIYYTGPEMAWTTSETSNTATVTLSATIKNGLPCGDISTALITFTVNGNPIASASNLPVDFIDPNNPALGGTASAIVQLNISGNASGDIFDIGVIISGNYTAGNFVPGVVTIIKPKPGGVIGGNAYLCNDSSVGYVKGSIDTNAALNFYVEFVKKGNKIQNPKGKVSLIVASYNKPDGTVDNLEHWYLIKSNAIASLNINSPTAIFSGKSNIAEINPSNGILTPIEGNCQMVLDLKDGSPDEVGITIHRNGGGLWYSNNWIKTKTVRDAICGGQIYISGPLANSAALKTASTVVESTSGIFKLQTWPNPSEGEFYLKLNSDNRVDKVEIYVYDINGREVYFNSGKANEEYHFGKTLESGMYFVNVVQADKSLKVKLIKY